MGKAAIFVTDGFEETEAVVTIDIMRRGGVQLDIVSLTGKKMVRGKHELNIETDILFDAAANANYDMLLIPGGTTKYLEYEGLVKLVKEYNAQGKYLSAICAAPAVFSAAGVLDGRKATIFPELKEYLNPKVIYVEDEVVTDGHVTTSRGPGTAMQFALRALELLEGPQAAERVKKAFLLK